MSEEYEGWYYEEEPSEPPRDGKIDEAKRVLMERFFQPDAQVAYYGRQIEIAVEAEFFHWITRKALNELVEERQIAFSEEKLEKFLAHFYWPKRHRYARRQIAATMRLIGEFSDPVFTGALGANGEQLMDAGFATLGFRILDKNVKQVNGLKWELSNHDLDRLVMRDGVLYGVEIKNRLPYIEQQEFETKLNMCRFFGVRPLFVARMKPANYMNRVWRAGGFSLLFKNQHYPLLATDLAKRVKAELGLPVLCIRALPDATLARFEAWHEKLLKGG